jgi:methyltransferase (TIGR00027 family)
LNAPALNKPALNLPAQSQVRSISDTARWVAYFRALETERPDALFRDPHAARLAGERGFEIAQSLSPENKDGWAWVMRTYLFDEFVRQEVAAGADMVLNLAAGLDARPYRLALPSTLRWVEVDLPDIVSYKEEILAGARPACHLERIAMDLADEGARRDLFAGLDRQAKKIAVLAEGLLIYFTSEQVGSLARVLAAGDHFHTWVIDLASPAQLKMMQWTMGKQLDGAGAAFKFGPPEGPEFFAPYGWAAQDVRGLLQTAVELNRAPAEQLRSPRPDGAPGRRLWSGVCLFTKRDHELKQSSNGARG